MWRRCRSTQPWGIEVYSTVKGPTPGLASPLPEQPHVSPPSPCRRKSEDLGCHPASQGWGWRDQRRSEGACVGSLALHMAPGHGASWGHTHSLTLALRHSPGRGQVHVLKCWVT